ncbi:PIN domain-containing protein [Streptomyces uncialis]|uniref:PIN domain-containing protein n=1 Tax=Streptomyces uncialis TaxID=1048205 RepID=UPI002F943582|nr:PIN domain-containing protein [Streptomyces uncialis]
MLVTPRPGVGRDHLRSQLSTQCTKVTNLWTAGPHDAAERLVAYLDWSTNALQALGNQISSKDIERLVLTRGHRTLLEQGRHLTEGDNRRIVNGLLNLELQQCAAAFRDAVDALDRKVKSWNDTIDLLVADTSFYIQHPDKIEIADLDGFGDGGTREIRLLFPMAVIDELDSLKQHRKSEVRWRAGHTLAFLDKRVLRDEPATIRAKSVRPDGSFNLGVSIEVLFDPPGHVRLPITDDEIVDRALAAQALAASPVTFITYDTGQCMRARFAGLKVIKLRNDEDAGPEPK